MVGFQIMLLGTCMMLIVTNSCNYKIYMVAVYCFQRLELARLSSLPSF